MLKQIISLLFGLLFAEPSLSAHEAGLGLIRQGPAHPVSRLMAENPAAKTMDEPALETAASAVDQRGNTDSAIVEEGVEDDARMRWTVSRQRQRVNYPKVRLGNSKNARWRMRP